MVTNFLKANKLGIIGSIYVQKGELDKALEYYNKGLEICHQLGNKLGEAHALGAIGLIYLEKGQLDKALTFLENSLKIYRKIDAKHLVNRTEVIINHINKELLGV